MNTGDLIRQLAERLNISQRQAHQLLHQELDAIAEQLAGDREVIIRGFGKFSLRPVRKTRSAPRGGTTVAFRAAQKLRDFVRNWRPS